MSDHHKRSKWRNISIGASQVIAGLTTGSPELLFAGTHNTFDGPVHELRHRAEHAATKAEKRAYRLRAVGLMAGSGVVAFLVDRALPMHSVGSNLVLGFFAVETAINVVGAVDSSRSHSTSSDTHSGFLHNAGDAVLSGATTAVLAAPKLGAEISPELASAMASWGHLGVIGAISLYGIATLDSD